MKKIVLQPVEMITPNGNGNYEPSRIRPPKIISEAEFLERYADYPHVMLISGVRQTAYSRGLDCWYAVVDEIDEYYPLPRHN